MTDEQYISQFLKKDSLFIITRMNGSLVVRRVLQDYIPDEEYIQKLLNQVLNPTILV